MGCTGEIMKSGVAGEISGVKPKFHLFYTERVTLTGEFSNICAGRFAICPTGGSRLAVKAI